MLGAAGCEGEKCVDRWTDGRGKYTNGNGPCYWGGDCAGGRCDTFTYTCEDPNRLLQATGQDPKRLSTATRDGPLPSNENANGGPTKSKYGEQCTNDKDCDNKDLHCEGRFRGVLSFVRKLTGDKGFCECKKSKKGSKWNPTEKKCGEEAKEEVINTDEGREDDEASLVKNMEAGSTKDTVHEKPKYTDLDGDGIDNPAFKKDEDPSLKKDVTVDVANQLNLERQEQDLIKILEPEGDSDRLKEPEDDDADEPNNDTSS